MYVMYQSTFASLSETRRAYYERQRFGQVFASLKRAPQPLQDAVLKTTPGTVSNVSLGGGHTLVLHVARDEAGQKDPSMPAVRDGITATLRGRKEQLLRAAYLSAARNDAVVVNHLAQRLVEGQGKIPSLAPAAPGAGLVWLTGIRRGRECGPSNLAARAHAREPI